MEDDSLQRTIFAVWAVNQQLWERVLLLVTGDMQSLSKTVGGVKRSIDYRTCVASVDVMFDTATNSLAEFRRVSVKALKTCHARLLQRMCAVSCSSARLVSSVSKSLGNPSLTSTKLNPTQRILFLSTKQNWAVSFDSLSRQEDPCYPVNVCIKNT